MAKIFSELIKIGIDYPCYPQLVSMIGQFLSPFSKNIVQLEEVENKFFLYDDFKIPKTPLAMQYGEFISRFLKEHPQLKEKIKGTKACLTGPFTLTFEIFLKENLAKNLKPIIFKEPRAVMVDWLVDKFAEMMKHIGAAYNDLGIDIISMDEPILGLLVGRKPLFHSEDFFIKTINKAVSGIKNMSSIHVCGVISPKLRDILLNTNVNIIDHEFRVDENNFRVFEKKHLLESDKLLAMGTIKSNFAPEGNKQIDDYIEDVNFLKKFIQRGIDSYG
ncbi:hypothetical protein LCGC14_2571660, partial [marine sediment metagenome]